MIRFSALFWIALVAVTGFGMFKVKYGVQSLEDELARVRKQTVAEQQEMRVLNAEWSYLTQPERLADLNQRFLQLAPIATKQYQQAISDIALRPPSVEAVFAAVAPQVAAPPPTTPQPAAVPVAQVAPAPLIEATVRTAAATRPTVAVQFVKASAAAKSPHSLDELFAQINGAR